jgi:hypothetical protein
MWYVYDKDTTVIQKTVKTPAAAKAWITRKQNEYLRKDAAFVSNEGPLFDWGYADAAWFHDFIEKTRVVKNLMTGAEVRITANTPRSCDPSTELYWSM